MVASWTADARRVVAPAPGGLVVVSGAAVVQGSTDVGNTVACLFVLPGTAWRTELDGSAGVGGSPTYGPPLAVDGGSTDVDVPEVRTFGLAGALMDAGGSTEVGLVGVLSGVPAVARRVADAGSSTDVAVVALGTAGRVAVAGAPAGVAVSGGLRRVGVGIDALAEAEGSTIVGV